MHRSRQVARAGLRGIQDTFKKLLSKYARKWNRLPTAKVLENPRARMVTDGSLGKRWESVSGNNKENR